MDLLKYLNISEPTTVHTHTKIDKKHVTIYVLNKANNLQSNGISLINIATVTAV